MLETTKGPKTESGNVYFRCVNPTAPALQFRFLPLPVSRFQPNKCNVSQCKAMILSQMSTQHSILVAFRHSLKTASHYIYIYIENLYTYIIYYIFIYPVPLFGVQFGAPDFYDFHWCSCWNAMKCQGSVPKDIARCKPWCRACTACWRRRRRSSMLQSSSLRHSTWWSKGEQSCATSSRRALLDCFVSSKSLRLAFSARQRAISAWSWSSSGSFNSPTSVDGWINSSDPTLSAVSFLPVEDVLLGGVALEAALEAAP